MYPVQINENSAYVTVAGEALDEIVVVAGPTGAGKTDYALALAAARGGEIISVDSRQLYRFISVGTAKPSGQWTPLPEDSGNASRKRDLQRTTLAPNLNRPPSDEGSNTAGRAYNVQGILYHLVDVLDPDQTFSAADFVQQAQQKIRAIQARGHVPILAGGTGLYFKALFDGLATLPPANPELRATLRSQADRVGRAALHQALAAIDPTSARAIPANNIQRVIRALEVFQLTGKPLSAWHREQAPSAPIKREVIILDPGKDELDRRLEERCRVMLDEGMIEETQALLERGFAKKCPALSGLGYPRIIEHLEGRLSRQELLDLLRRDTRQYVKRQRTWFRHQLASKGRLINAVIASA